MITILIFSLRSFMSRDSRVRSGLIISCQMMGLECMRWSLSLWHGKIKSISKPPFVSYFKIRLVGYRIGIPVRHALFLRFYGLKGQLNYDLILFQEKVVSPEGLFRL